MFCFCTFSSVVPALKPETGMGEALRNGRRNSLEYNGSVYKKQEICPLYCCISDSLISAPRNRMQIHRYSHSITRTMEVAPVHVREIAEMIKVN